jgi:hypothetical protein
MRTAHRSRRSIPPRTAFAGSRFPPEVIVPGRGHHRSGADVPSRARRARDSMNPIVENVRRLAHGLRNSSTTRSHPPRRSRRPALLPMIKTLLSCEDASERYPTRTPSAASGNCPLPTPPGSRPQRASHRPFAGLGGVPPIGKVSAPARRMQEHLIIRSLECKILRFGR